MEFALSLSLSRQQRSNDQQNGALSRNQRLKKRSGGGGGGASCPTGLFKLASATIINQRKKKKKFLTFMWHSNGMFHYVFKKMGLSCALARLKVPSGWRERKSKNPFPSKVTRWETNSEQFVQNFPSLPSPPRPASFSAADIAVTHCWSELPVGGDWSDSPQVKKRKHF